MGPRAGSTRSAAVACFHAGFASPLREYQTRPGLGLDRRLGDCFDVAAPAKRPRLRRCRRAPTLVSTRLSTSSSRSRPEAHSPNTSVAMARRLGQWLGASSRARFRIRILCSAVAPPSWRHPWPCWCPDEVCPTSLDPVVPPSWMLVELGWAFALNPCSTSSVSMTSPLSTR